ncbi:S-adenosyl-L-methionine-dependent methyltransferase [Artomyces pyxidatus]|uniref:S-adenosyl-L-methionine-dependent methyltransferase n=1 Tax=Artomyces pyxidatus TaxID=48021 RepID=A0ACB8T909_9AGAM|nr:S-adenosyl-L-methionine-dependent methyltransferase [Artomyces pyxidatus]
MSTKVTATVVDSDPSLYEENHVHQVYDQIASHFSATRYKPWPIIAAFLSSLPPGSVGLDSGTGNGKYLPLPIERPGSVWTIGLDRSRNLLRAARTAGQSTREVVWGDVLGKSWRDGAFDYAISIATIHHLATPKRRMDAVQRLFECVSPTHGRVLIYVWAIEQDAQSKRQIPTSTDQSALGQDVFVPWVLTSQTAPRKPNRQHVRDEADLAVDTQPVEPQTFNRYYHMFAEGELDELVRCAAVNLGLAVGASETDADAGIEIVQRGWERSNHYVEVRRWRRA